MAGRVPCPTSFEVTCGCQAGKIRAQLSADFVTACMSSPLCSRATDGARANRGNLTRPRQSCAQRKRAAERSVRHSEAVFKGSRSRPQVPPPGAASSTFWLLGRLCFEDVDESCVQQEHEG